MACMTFSHRERLQYLHAIGDWTEGGRQPHEESLHPTTSNRSNQVIGRNTGKKTDSKLCAGNPRPPAVLSKNMNYSSRSDSSSTTARRTHKYTHLVDGDGKPDPFRVSAHGRVNPHHLPELVHEGPAAVARVDRGVGLDEVTLVHWRLFETGKEKQGLV